MSQPTPYNRQTSFTTVQQEAPTDPLPGDDLDAELNAVKTTLDQILANIELIQRDDGALANESVGRDQLATNIQLGFNAPSAWADDTNYTTLDTVFFEGKFYRCLVSHLSDDFATDLAAGKWELIADFTGAVDEAAVFGPASAVVDNFATYAASTGKTIKDSLVSLDTDTTMAANSDLKIPSQKAVKAYIDAIPGAGGALADLDTVGTAQIDNDAVTYAKLQNVSATSRVLARKTAGSGNAEECTISEILDFIGSAAHGDVLYRDSSSWALLPAGTSGQFLQTSGAGNDIAWADQTVSTIDFQEFLSSGTWTKPSGYDANSRVFIEAWGGGGGGAGASGSPGGGGGGGGGYNAKWFKLSDMGATETITVGAGAAGTLNSNASAGGNTTVGSKLTAYGGGGGKPNTSGGAGGGGGGPFGAGASVTQGAPNIITSYDDATTTSTYLGQGASGGGTVGAPGVEHGGGGGDGTGTAGGSSVYGGGGGGGRSFTVIGAAGTSVRGGAGGTPDSGNGSVPGGGGGSGANAVGGNGAAGKVVITVFPA